MGVEWVPCRHLASSFSSSLTFNFSLSTSLRVCQLSDSRKLCECFIPQCLWQSPWLVKPHQRALRAPPKTSFARLSIVAFDPSYSTPVAGTRHLFPRFPSTEVPRFNGGVCNWLDGESVRVHGTSVLISRPKEQCGLFWWARLYKSLDLLLSLCVLLDIELVESRLQRMAVGHHGV